MKCQEDGCQGTTTAHKTSGELGVFSVPDAVLGKVLWHTAVPVGKTPNATWMML